MEDILGQMFRLRFSIKRLKKLSANTQTLSQVHSAGIGSLVFFIEL